MCNMTLKTSLHDKHKEHVTLIGPWQKQDLKQDLFCFQHKIYFITYIAPFPSFPALDLYKSK